MPKRGSIAPIRYLIGAWHAGASLARAWPARPDRPRPNTLARKNFAVIGPYLSRPSVSGLLSLPTNFLHHIAPLFFRRLPKIPLDSAGYRDPCTAPGDALLTCCWGLACGFFINSPWSSIGSPRLSEPTPSG